MQRIFAHGFERLDCGGWLLGEGRNYRAACRSRSKAEFIAKIGLVEEEADECAFWQEMILEGKLIPAKRLEDLSKRRAS